jgi:hypothetical protein
LKARQDELAAASATTKQLEAAIQQREKALAEKSQEVERLTAALAKSERDARAREAEFEKIKAAAIAGGPVIEIVEPQIRIQGQRGIGKVRPGDVTVVGRIEAGGGLSKATLDGAPIKLDAENKFSVKLSPGKRVRASLSAVDGAGNRETVELGLSPNGELSVIFSGDASRPSAERQLIGTPLPSQLLRQLGTYHALVIGNNNYKMMPRLETAIDDARVVASLLQRDYGFNVTLLIDATRYDILSALNRLRETLTQENHLLIYYAGHGELDRVNQRGHWLPVDAEPNSSANWISNIAISDILNAMSVTQLLVVADSCYSGAMTRSAVARLDPGRNSEEKVRLLRIMAQQRSRMVLTSGGLEPVLDGSGSGHSVFAAAFIDALKRNGGALTGQEIHGVVLPTVATTADRFAKHHQVPEYAPIKYAGHESGDFIFARVN